MKVKLFIMMVTLVMLFTSCTQEDTVTSTEQKQTQEQEAIQTEEKKIIQKDSLKDFLILAQYISKLNEMVGFMEAGIEKSGEMNLSMEFLNIKMSGAQLQGALSIYENYGANWDSGLITDEDYDITTRTTMVTANGITTYKNVSYESKLAEQESVSTIVEYKPDSNVVQITTTVFQPETSAIYQFYLDDNGVLFYVFGEVGMATLFTDVMYYNGDFIGIAKAWFDGASELNLPYDLSESKPASYEDILVYDNYRVKFTYNGTLCEYVIND